MTIENRELKALIAFIVMAVVVLTLIEINERVKAKKTPKDEDCQKETDGGDCSACELLSVCEKKSDS